MANLMTYRNNRNNLMFPETGFFDELLRPFFGSSQQSAFRVDVKDMGDSYLLEADIPGATKDNVQVDLDDGVLTIRAEWNSQKKDEGDKGDYIISERRYGVAERSFSVENIKEEEITAAYVNGVLKLTMPKKAEDKRQPRKIEIQ